MATTTPTAAVTATSKPRPRSLEAPLTSLTLPVLTLSPPAVGEEMPEAQYTPVPVAAVACTLTLVQVSEVEAEADADALPPSPPPPPYPGPPNPGPPNCRAETPLLLLLLVARTEEDSVLVLLASAESVATVCAFPSFKLAKPTPPSSQLNTLKTFLRNLGVKKRRQISKFVCREGFLCGLADSRVTDDKVWRAAPDLSPEYGPKTVITITVDRPIVEIGTVHLIADASKRQAKRDT